MNHETPKLAVDCIVLVTKDDEQGIVLIQRKYPPLGCAIPGGFVDVGEKLRDAAVREMSEELNLDVKILSQLGVYDDPARDPRKHVVSVAFLAWADGLPVAGDDAREAFVWKFMSEPMPEMVCDHRQILLDYAKQVRIQFFGEK